MPSRRDENAKSIYAQSWDRYVEEWLQRKKPDSGDQAWPGDEWGSPNTWETVYRCLFVPAGVEHWRRAVEIGSGSGKYTSQVLARSGAVVRAYDVSARFLEICKTRCQELIDQERLTLHLLAAASADEMLADLTACGWQRTVDAFYSIDAMVHVDLQYLIVYLITAGLALKPGGKLLLSLADATNDLGFRQMLEDIWYTYPEQINPVGSRKFEWTSPDLVRSILPRLGFQLEWFNNAFRDIFFFATLVKPEEAERMRSYLLARTPSGG